jgi:hypothetical protein
MAYVIINSRPELLRGDSSLKVADCIYHHCHRSLTRTNHITAQQDGHISNPITASIFLTNLSTMRHHIDGSSDSSKDLHLQRCET